jgi:hypothetical protein
MTTATAIPAGIAPSLRRLYFVRFGFALIWAASVIATISTLSPLGVTLLVLYPVFDVAAAVVDARSAKETKPFVGLYVNMAISLLAGAGRRSPRRPVSPESCAYGESGPSSPG